MVASGWKACDLGLVLQHGQTIFVLDLPDDGHHVSEPMQRYRDDFRHHRRSACQAARLSLTDRFTKSHATSAYGSAVGS